jgi:hypothetical protein
LTRNPVRRIGRTWMPDQVRHDRGFNDMAAFHFATWLHFILPVT